MAGRKPYRRRRRIAPGFLSCARCDRDLPDGTGSEPSAFRWRTDRGKRSPMSYCFACERIVIGFYHDRLMRNDPDFAERQRVSTRAWHERKRAMSRDERQWATDLLKSDVQVLVKQGWSRRAIAAAIEANTTSISMWEKGARLAFATTVVRVHPRLLALRDVPVGRDG